MSKSVENKVVEMSFNSSKFEAGAARTLSMLDRLKEALNFKNSTTGLSKVQSEVDKFNTESISRGIEGVSAKFLALSTVGITAMANISSAVLRTGADFAKQFTTDPMTQGFSEYELKMGSIQTIMAGTGASLDEVKGKLDELNAYSDKTIYSFADMTTNIGKFTNAGVSLNDSVQAIQGVANVAAVSGANAEEASRAMYNFGQALSQGSVKLIDWKSIELANMGTKEFKEQLIQSAVAMGTLTAQGDHWVTANGTMVDSAGAFNTSLNEGWLTTEALTKTLKDYADITTDIGKKAFAAATEVKTFSQLVSTVKESLGSAWSQGFENVIGDFEQAKGLWTAINSKISETIANNAGARVAMLKEWSQGGGRNDLIEGLVNSLKALKSWIDPIRFAFRSIFPKKTAEDLLSLTERFKNFTAKLKMGGKGAEAMVKIFGVVFRVLKLGATIVGGVVKVITSFFGALISNGSGAGHALGTVAGWMGNLLNVAQWLATNGLALVAEKAAWLGTQLGKLIGNLGPLTEWVNEAARALGENLTKKFQELQERLEPVIKKVKEFFENLRGGGGGGGEDGSKVGFFAQMVERLSGAFDRAKEAWHAFTSGIGNGASSIGEFFSNIGSALADGISNIGSAIGDALASDTFDKLLAGGIFATVATLIFRITTIIRRGLTGLFLGDLLENAQDVLDGFSNSLNAFAMKTKAEALLKIAIAVGVLAASIFLMSRIDPGKAGASLGILGAGLTGLTGALVALDKWAGAGKRSFALALSLIAIAGALILLSIAVRILSGLETEELAKGVLGVIALLIGMAVASRIMQSAEGGLIKGALTMIGFGIGIIFLAFAVKQMAKLEWDEMLRGLFGILTLIVSMSTALEAVSSDDVAKKGMAFLLMAIAMKAMANVIESMAAIPFGQLVKGLWGVALTLLILIAALKNMPDNMKELAFGLLLASGGLWVMSKAVETMANIKWYDMLRGVAGLGIVLMGLVAAMILMNGNAMGAVAMLGAAIAVATLAWAFGEFSKVDWGGIGKGLVAIAGVMLILGIAAYAIGPMALVITALGVGVLALGAGFALMGVGALLAAMAIEKLVATGDEGIAKFKQLVGVVISMLPEFFAVLAEALVGFAQALLERLPEFLEAFETVANALLDVLIRLAPKLFEFIGVLMGGILSLLDQHIPGFVAVGFKFLMSLLSGLDANIEQITEKVMSIIEKFLTAVEENLQPVIDAGVALLVSFLEGLAGKADEISTAVGDLVEAIITELGNLALDLADAGTDALVDFLGGLTDDVTKISDAATELVTTLITEIGAAATEVSAAGALALAKFLYGIAENIHLVCGGAQAVIRALVGCLGHLALSLLPGSGFSAIGNFISGIVSRLGEIVSRGAEVIGKFLSGITSRIGEILTKGREAAGKILTGVRERLTEIYNRGADIATNLISGIRDAITNGWDAVVSFVQGKIEALGNLASKAMDFVTGEDRAGPAKGDKGEPPKEDKFGQAGKKLGGALISGLSKSMEDKDLAVLKDAMSKIPEILTDMDVMSPTITPVLDLSRVQREASKLGGMIGLAPMSPDAPYVRGAELAHVSVNEADANVGVAAPSVTTFIQNNHSPKALSTADIYRGTKSQIAMAKRR